MCIRDSFDPKNIDHLQEKEIDQHSMLLPLDGKLDISVLNDDDDKHCEEEPLRNLTASLIMKDEKMKTQDFAEKFLDKLPTEPSKVETLGNLAKAIDNENLLKENGNLVKLPPVSITVDLSILEPQYLSEIFLKEIPTESIICLLYTSPSPRDATLSRMPSSA